MRQQLTSGLLWFSARVPRFVSKEGEAREKVPSVATDRTNESGDFRRIRKPSLHGHLGLSCARGEGGGGPYRSRLSFERS